MAANDDGRPAARDAAARAALRVIAQRGDDQFLIGDDPNSREGYLVTAGQIVPTSVISQLARGYWDVPRLTRAAEHALLALVTQCARRTR